jgi:hypothetical protein
MKHLDLDDEAMLEILESYFSKAMPLLGVPKDLSYQNGTFRIEFMERQTPTTIEPTPTQPEIGLRVMRQEGVK